MKDGEDLTSLVKQFFFSKEERKVLEPLYKKRNALDKQIQDFVGKVVLPRLPIDNNKKYKAKFNIPQGWIKVKDMGTMMDLNNNLASFKDVVGWGEK